MDMADQFFLLSKILWFVAQPDHLLLLMLLFGLFLWRRTLGVLLVWTSVLAMLTISVYPVANYLLEPLEQRFPQPVLSEIKEPIAGIIVLGGGENAEMSSRKQWPEFNQAADRMMALPGLMLRYPSAKVIFTGGSGSILAPEFRGGDVAEQWLHQQGMGSRVTIERDSRNTFQNAIYTKDLIANADGKVEGKWLLVTSAFHMPRSVGVYRKAGIDVIPFPVDYRASTMRFDPGLNKNMNGLSTAVKEWIGLLAYHYTEKTDVLFPAPVSTLELENE